MAIHQRVILTTGQSRPPVWVARRPEFPRLEHANVRTRPAGPSKPNRTRLTRSNESE